jgi:hypothetical protein
MINIKAAASLFATVTVAAVSAQKIVSRIKTEKTIKDFREAVDNAVIDFRSAEVIAFDKAQDLITERMLSGYYDEKSDAEAQHDFAVLYANFLTK